MNKIEFNKLQSNAGRIDLHRARFAAGALVIYKALKQDELIAELCQLFEHMDSERPELYRIIELYSSLGYRIFTAGTGLREYIIRKLLHNENPFSRAAESRGAECLTGAMSDSVENDLEQLQMLASIRSEWIRDIIAHLCKGDEVMQEAVMKLPLWPFEDQLELSAVKDGLQAAEASGSANGQKGISYDRYDREFAASGFSQDDTTDNNVYRIKRLMMGSKSWSDCARELAEFHKKNGSGIFSRYRAFVWRHVPDGAFVGVESPDPVRFSDLISYELEREDVIQNTLHFLDGRPANNILLYGDRGTGKSTTVKALVNEYHGRGLRMIEVPKGLLADFSLIVRQLAVSNLKFILFVDDLAFEDNEENYTALKAALEGGLESKPDNVLIYATSNRKHLIKERFSDRAGLVSGNADDEVRAADTIQEKLSLSDRFGMTVVFSSPDKRRYLEIVEGIAKKRGLDADREYIQREALKWELQYNGRSPRTARQFVDWLEGQAGTKGGRG